MAKERKTKKQDLLTPEELAKLVFGMLKGRVAKCDFELLRLSLVPIAVGEDVEISPEDRFYRFFNLYCGGKLCTLSISKAKFDNRINFHLCQPFAGMHSALVYGDLSKVFTARKPFRLPIKKEDAPNKQAKKFLKKMSALFSLYGGFAPDKEYGEDDCCSHHHHARRYMLECDELEMYEYTYAIATKSV